jgi:ornithine cyclodeaminase/alanine dehydrogenase
MLPAPIQREEVRRRLPPLAAQLDLVETTLRSLARGTVEMPPKIGVHPRADSFIHAMPAYLQGDDVVALKWVAGYPANPSRGLPYISGVIVVNDAESGSTIALMDAAEITAARTAAASGVCIRAWAPDGWQRAAILGCGEQGRYHAAVLRHLNPNAVISGYDPVAERAAELCDGAIVAARPEEAVTGTEIVVTAGPIVDAPPSAFRRNWVGDGPWLLLPIDFDFYLSAAVLADAELFVTDDVPQFEAYREHGHFRDWPAPVASVGGALEENRSARRVVACNLGVAALDAAFAKSVLESG